MISRDQQIQILMVVFPNKISLKIIIQIMDLVLKEIKIKIWEDFKIFSKIYLVKLLLIKGEDQGKNLKLKDKI